MKRKKIFSGKIPPKPVMIIAALLLFAIYYYIALPAVNIHSVGLWKFILGFLVIILVLVCAPHIEQTGDSRRPIRLHLVQKSMRFKVILSLIVILGAIYFIGFLLSSPIINAKKYQQLMTVEKGEFSEDIAQISYDQIPLLDSESASILASRKMGSLVDLASQFEVSDLYNQINYQDQPVRITPLRYAGLIKWFTNKNNGISAYIRIDMASQKTELVRLKEGMKYTLYDHFGRNLYRHLRFKYPTYIFDDISFELDEEGTPYWVCSVSQYKIGLFGGHTIGRVVLCNAITGECEDYSVEDAPSWVDRVYSASLLVELYDYYGTLKHGFLNSILSQKDCLSTTNGYNYLAINDDVWVYTGVTSITSDQSNVGFVLMNQRTMETKYYEIEGAIEDSAMSSAEGKVQNLGYVATFPLLLNIDKQPTYFMSLKDASGLVKKYAMVNVQNYQIVSTGDSVAECEKGYTTLLKENKVTEDEPEPVVTLTETSGKIQKIAEAVIDGNSHYYILLDQSDDIFDVPVGSNLTIIRYNVGDPITFEYKEGVDSKTVINIKEN
ncbi:MAG: CvpA family protein [Eubacteriales bacterium]|nr:CvpA family protein [Eubacteriales bacterium]